MSVPWAKRLPCRRTHESQDELYERIADKLDRFTAELKRQRKPGDPDPTVPQDSPEFEERFAALYYMIQERVAEDAAEMKARGQAQKQKARQRAGSPSRSGAGD